VTADRVDSDVDGEAATERRTEGTPPPVDRPGAEGVPSRADSRIGAAAANEEHHKCGDTATAIQDPNAFASDRGLRGHIDREGL
jgi:hypothetical protein